jgi:hypothetical protein
MSKKNIDKQKTEEELVCLLDFFSQTDSTFWNKNPLLFLSFFNKLTEIKNKIKQNV